MRLKSWAPVFMTLAVMTACDRGETAPDMYADALFVDVRTPEEYSAGHVDGALLIPVDEIEARIAELQPHRDRRIVLYCRSGRRSGIALDVLRRHGFENAENGGAFTALAGTGLPTAFGLPQQATPGAGSQPGSP